MRDIILARLAALLEEKIDPKLRAERLKRKDKAYDNRVHRNSIAQPRDEDPPPSDDELKDMAKDYGYGKKEEAIDFPKTTTRGKAARATAADTLRDVKSRMQTSGLAKKPGDAAKLTKQFSKENYKQRESTNLKDRIVGMLAEKVNPWAVCHSSTGPKKSAKFERCVKDVKKKEGIQEASLKDIMVDALMEARGDMLIKHTNKKVAPERARNMQGSVYQEKKMQAPGVVASANKLKDARAKMKAPPPPAPEPKPASGRTYVTKRSDYGDNTYRGDSD